MVCLKCGQEITDGVVCPSCGTVADQKEENQEQADAVKKGAKKGTKESSFYGVITLIIAVMFPALGIVYAIRGLYAYKNTPNRVMCIIALVLSSVLTLMYLAFYIGLMLMFTLPLLIFEGIISILFLFI